MATYLNDSQLVLPLTVKELRMYADEVVNHYGCEGLTNEQECAFRWMISEASDDTVRSMGAYVLEADTLWEMWRRLVNDSVLWHYREYCSAL